MVQEHNTENALSNFKSYSIQNISSPILDDAACERVDLTFTLILRLKTRP